MSDKLKKYIPGLPSSVHNHDCNVCPLAKQTRLSFPDRNIFSTKIFDIVHMDVWGPFKVPTVTGVRYFLTIVDDFSRSTWTVLMSAKSEVTDNLINLYQMIKTQYEESIKIIRSDNGT